MMHNPLLELPLHAWQDNIDPALQKQAQDHLEAGGVLYLPHLAGAMKLLGITKRSRSEYDHLMLHLHDAQKADLDYQQKAPQMPVPFAAGST